ncbi:hypothetical protein FXO38_11622 [Capsicum annuum]|nr:hypothetical protein FXO38_11622 [Capsicum annuum]KAF3667123.1 hypothetical protein FXO37_10160 [Capsicum annuum]
MSGSYDHAMQAASFGSSNIDPAAWEDKKNPGESRILAQLNNIELAVNLAKRGNLPGTENLVVQRFQELFAQTKYKEAAELAAESPQGILRTQDTVAKFQNLVGVSFPIFGAFDFVYECGLLSPCKPFPLHIFPSGI